MLYDHFFTSRHFKVNRLVRAYMISESFMWSSWNLIIPIFAVFISEEIKGGNIQSAAVGYSTYLISRVVFELLSGKILQRTGDRQKVVVAVAGMTCLSIAYIGFTLASDILTILFFYFFAGVGIGFASPAKNALFSIHLDPNKEAKEWSVVDALQFSMMAICTSVGGYIALNYGFKSLFIIAAVLNYFAILPYAVFLEKPKRKK